MTLESYVERWLGTRTARLAPNSLRGYRSALREHVLPALGGLELEDITTYHVRAWIGQLIVAKHPTNSIKAMQNALSTVLTDCLIDGLVSHNAAHGAGRRLLPGRSATAPKALTPEELHSFLLASRQLSARWPADAFLVYSRTGLRLGELLGLEKRHVILEDQALRIDQTYHGGSAGFGPPKGGQARVVEVSPQTLRVLERRVATLHSPGAFVFPGQDPHRPIHPSSMEWRFDQAAGIAAIPEHYTVHSLRHTYASILLAHGAPPQYVQQQLGHANFAFTVDVYGSGLRARRPDLMAILDRDPSHHQIVRAERGPAKVIPIRKPG